MVIILNTASPYMQPLIYCLKFGDKQHALLVSILGISVFDPTEPKRAKKSIRVEFAAVEIAGFWFTFDRGFVHLLNTLPNRQQLFSSIGDFPSGVDRIQICQTLWEQ